METAAVIPSVTCEEYLASGAWGLSASVDLFNCKAELITAPKAPDILREFAAALCREVDMTPHGEPIVDCFGEGELKGHSMLQFIKTSSIAVHCDDVGNKDGTTRVFVDLFSCKWFDAEQMAKFCQDFFGAKEVNVRSLLRR